jgi:RNA polymerase sigma-70 factor, ECF subfamily
MDLILADIDGALPAVHDYLLHRCGGRALAEDLTSEVTLAAVDRVRTGQLGTIEVGYLFGIARHKLVDHWRRQEREQRHLVAYVNDSPVDDGDELFEPGRAANVLLELNPIQRAALTLRYVDDLPVREVARILERAVHATETLLVRAKRAFRARYAIHEDHS